MTETIVIPRGERGTVRVLAVDLPPEEAHAFAADPAAVDRALGTPGLDPEYVDVFPIARLDALGLPAYLSEGLGIPTSELAADTGKLEALEGHVAVISSRAFGADGRSITVAPPLRLVGTYREERQPVSFGELPAGGADGILEGPKAPPPVRRGRNTQALTILILILAIIGFIVLNGAR